ncbi:hypothetical protein [Dendrosporobacter sp. 1207_IL3150]|uniref:hypothetical protein n=1 Tax=Dendrosporobacter sp. 1207_IL3150 TaxID=3084054 RepID=UPI002FD9E9D9
MQLWLGLLTGLVGVILLFRWLFLRRLDWQIKLLEMRLARITAVKNIDKARSKSLLKDIYSHINITIEKQNQTAAYQAIDLLKLAFGEKLDRSDEPMRLMAVAVSALRVKQPDVAGYVLDAYKPLIRNLSDTAKISTIEQLTLIAMVSLKSRNAFMLAKITDLICLLLEQLDKNTSKKVIISGLRGLKVIGAMSLKRHDEALFREISLKVGSINQFDEEDISIEIVHILTGWLHRVIKNEDKVMFSIFVQSTLEFYERGTINNKIFAIIVNEWQNLAGTAVLNPRSSMAAEILDFLLLASERRFDERCWLLAISAAAKTARLAISQHELEDGFKIAYPLLDMGRRLLGTELRLMDNTNDMRQKALFLIVRESVMLASLQARKDMTSSTGEIIAQLYNCWARYPNMRGNQKSVKKYCQFILLYWMKNRKRQARRGIPEKNELTEPSLLTELEKERFGLS